MAEGFRSRHASTSSLKRVARQVDDRRAVVSLKYVVHIILVRVLPRQIIKDSYVGVVWAEFVNIIFTVFPHQQWMNGGREYQRDLGDHCIACFKLPTVTCMFFICTPTELCRSGHRPLHVFNDPVQNH